MVVRSVRDLQYCCGLRPMLDMYSFYRDRFLSSGVCLSPVVRLVKVYCNLLVRFSRVPLRSNLGRVLYSYVLLSPNSWYRSNGWEINKHTERCTSHVCAGLQCEAVFGWGLQKRKSMQPSEAVKSMAS